MEISLQERYNRKFAKAKSDIRKMVFRCNDPDGVVAGIINGAFVSDKQRIELTRYYLSIRKPRQQGNRQQKAV